MFTIVAVVADGGIIVIIIGYIVLWLRRTYKQTDYDDMIDNHVRSTEILYYFYTVRIYTHTRNNSKSEQSRIASITVHIYI